MVDDVRETNLQAPADEGRAGNHQPGLRPAEEHGTGTEIGPEKGVRTRSLITFHISHKRESFYQQ